MNKARVLFLAQKRALKGDSDKEESQGGTGAGERDAVSEGSQQGNAVVQSVGVGERQTPLKRARLESLGEGEKDVKHDEPLVVLERSLSRVPGEEGEVMELSLVQGGSSLRGGPSVLPSVGNESVEKCTLLRFHTGLGWLGKVPGPSAPVDALGAFELGPDLKKLDSQRDEDVISGAKDALGVLGTLVMNLTERVEKNRGEAVSYFSQVDLKETERVQAVKQAEELRGILATKSEELNAEKGKVVKLEEKLCSVEKALEDETKNTSLLRLDIGSLQEELGKEKKKVKGVQEALEKVEKESIITYKDAIEKYRKSEEFDELVNLKAGYFHEEGFNDCISFVGAGNIVDPTIHNVQSFRTAALAGMSEQEQAGDVEP